MGDNRSETGQTPPGLYGWSHILSNEAEHVPNTNFTSLKVPAAFGPITKHINSKTHTLHPLGRGGAEALTRSEADTCQQSPPCLPLAALTMSSSKAAPAEGEWREFLFFFCPPNLFCVISSLECTLLNFRQLSAP